MMKSSHTMIVLDDERILRRDRQEGRRASQNGTILAPCVS
jgi:hypothetical protein